MKNLNDNIDELEIKMEGPNIGIIKVKDCKLRLIFNTEKNADIKLAVTGILKEAYLAGISSR